MIGISPGQLIGQEWLAGVVEPLRKKGACTCGYGGEGVGFFWCVAVGYNWGELLQVQMSEVWWKIVWQREVIKRWGICWIDEDFEEGAFENWILSQEMNPQCRRAP